MLDRWIGRKQQVGILLLRLVLAVIFIAHGGQKLFGWFGGGGIYQTTELFTQMGLIWPGAIAWFTACVEFFWGDSAAGRFYDARNRIVFDRHHDRRPGDGPFTEWILQRQWRF